MLLVDQTVDLSKNTCGTGDCDKNPTYEMNMQDGLALVLQELGTDGLNALWKERKDGL